MWTLQIAVSLMVTNGTTKWVTCPFAESDESIVRGGMYTTVALLFLHMAWRP